MAGNFGQAGENLTAFDGDVNGDGVVDGVDADIVMANMGKRVLHVDWDVNGEPLVTDGVGHWEEIEYQQPPEATLYSNGHPPGCNLPPCFDHCGCCLGCGGACDCGINCRGREFVGVAIAIDPPIGFGPDICPDDCDPDCGWDDVMNAPHGPCHPFCGLLPFDPCDERCGKDKDGNDYGKCHLECPTRFCHPDCCDEDPECDPEDEEQEPYDECHSLCPERYCHPHCCQLPDCDQEVEKYSKCHPLCPDPDPCDPSCPERTCNSYCCDEEGAQYGPCHEDCESQEIDPCDARCNVHPDADPENPYGPCHEDCPTRFCDPDCCTPEYDCNQEQEQYGHDHPQCQSVPCNPECPDNWGPHCILKPDPNCNPFFTNSLTGQWKDLLANALKYAQNACNLDPAVCPNRPLSNC